MGLSRKQVTGDQGVEWGQSESLKCPRCASTNTKFCYYNNYNKSQPRHLCKSCKRHWTKGGTLRNVPVGGARKNKRPKLSKSAAAPPKNMSNTLYHALIGRSSSPLPHQTKPLDNIPSSPFAAIPNTDFQFSSFTTFDINASLNPSSFQPLNAFDHFPEESTITTVNIPGTSGAMDLPNYWSWNDIDVLTSGDLSLSWDDQDKAVIKP